MCIWMHWKGRIFGHKNAFLFTYLFGMVTITEYAYTKIVCYHILFFWFPLLVCVVIRFIHQVVIIMTKPILVAAWMRWKIHFGILAVLELNVVFMLSIYQINGDGYLYCLWLQFNVCIAMFSCLGWYHHFLLHHRNYYCTHLLSYFHYHQSSSAL
jgi:hypothetical protein